jgi:P4 family phage/plasmid primase-like protien
MPKNPYAAPPVDDEGRPAKGDGPAQVEKHREVIQGQGSMISPRDELPDGFRLDEDGAVQYHTPTLDLDLTLDARHWRELTVESGIAPELVQARGYATMGEGARDALRKHYSITPKALKPEHFPGLFVPMFTLGQDEGMSAQWKPATPYTNGDGKPQKYVSRAGAANVLDVNPLRAEALKDAGRRLWITEGVKKADALASRGEVVIGLTGVFNWRSKAGTLPEWEDVPLKGRELVVCFDADAVDKPNVLRAMVRLGRWLKSKGAKVRFLIVPAEVNGTRVKGADDYLAAGGTLDGLLEAATATEPEPEKSDDTFTDARLAERLADEVLADRFIWVSGLGWMAWDGHRWEVSTDVTVREAIRRWALTRFTESVQGSTRPDKATLDGWRSMLNAGRERAVMDLARGIVERRVAELDADADLINTPAGVVDLRTGRLQDPDPAMLMTKITRGSYRPGFTHPDWIAALESLHEPERAWFQARVGQAITGHPTPDGIMPVLQGSGENGKSLLTTDGAVRGLGDYASMASTKLFQAGKGSEHSTERADLRGRRLLVAEELTEGRSIDVTALKQIQDVTTIRARYIRQDNIEFLASHSLLTTTNYVPVVAEVDHGTWRRLALLRFPFTFRKPDEELAAEDDRRGDPELKGRIRAGADGQHDAIVTWAVEGAMAWYADPSGSMATTDRVKVDTRAWQMDADRILGFWSEMLVADRDACVITVELLNTFNRWLDENGHNGWSKETFHPRFSQHAETARNRVQKGRPNVVRGLSRAANLNDRKDPLPVKPEVYSGVRFREPKDDQGSDQRGQTGQTLRDNAPRTRESGEMPRGLSGLSTAADPPRITAADSPGSRFRSWIVDQTEHSDPGIRTFAVEVAHDTTWPMDATTLEELDEYLEQCGAVYQAQEALARAWNQWRWGTRATA